MQTCKARDGTWHAACCPSVWCSCASACTQEGHNGLVGWTVLQSVLVDFGVVEEQNKYGCGEVDCSIVEFRQGILEPQRWLNCADAVGRERGSGNQHCGGGDGSVEGASVEAAKPARTLQRRGRGGDAAMGGTAWCRQQCVVPSWGRHVARAACRERE